MDQVRKDNRAMLTELIEAAKPFLVDDIIMPVEGIDQCVHCGDHSKTLQPITHHPNCRAERLRAAIKAAKGVLE